MNNQEAKFILGAYQPDGRDAGDAAFASALEQASRDPELRAWFESQRTFDAAFSAKLRAISPPPGLHEAILAGVRTSAPHPQRRQWINPLWLAAAAALALAALVGVSRRNSATRPAGAELAHLALRDLADAHDEHVGYPPDLATVQAKLASTPLPFTRHLELDLGELGKSNCRTVMLGGRKVFEICFQRDGIWYHLYAGRRDDFAPGTFDPKTLMKGRGDYASTVWADAYHIYALVSGAGTEALRGVL